MESTAPPINELPSPPPSYEVATNSRPHTPQQPQFPYNPQLSNGAQCEEQIVLPILPTHDKSCPITKIPPHLYYHNDDTVLPVMCPPPGIQPSTQSPLPPLQTKPERRSKWPWYACVTIVLLIIIILFISHNHHNQKR
ncbi:unnamed protein product, partial [Mesorhabditis belari]|uniref:Uncharacterized protein n=1 Tax=Mesorhabditis belari TaxID=2138241 RepID=A0AAF3EKC4_9BILA